MQCTQRASVLAAVGLAALAATAPGAIAATLRCGDTVTADVRLRTDLRGCPAHGLVIGADGVTVDLDGHTIAGDAIASTANPDVGVLSEDHDGVRIKNGTIEGFDIGAYVERAAASRMSGLTVRDSTINGILARNSAGIRVNRNDSRRSGFAGIVLLETARSSVVGNVTAHNAVVGIGVFGREANDNVIEHNVVSDNDDGGIVAGFEARRTHVAHNVVSGNAFAGIILDDADAATVAGNRVARNSDGIIVIGDDNRIVDNLVSDARGCDDECGYGISVEGGARNAIVENIVSETVLAGIRLDAFVAPVSATVLRSNLVREAGTDGIAIGAGNVGLVEGTLLERNVATGAGNDGFDVQSAATTLTSNLAFGNGALGFRAVPGVTDGGGNRAARNGDSRQCLNLRCGR